MITDSSFKKFLIVPYIASDPLYKSSATFLFFFFFLIMSSFGIFWWSIEKGMHKKGATGSSLVVSMLPRKMSICLMSSALWEVRHPKYQWSPQISVIFLLFFSLPHQLGFKNKSVFDERSNGIITLRLLRARLQLSRHHHLRIPQNSEWHNQCLPVYVWTLVNLWLC